MQFGILQSLAVVLADVESGDPIVIEPDLVVTRIVLLKNDVRRHIGDVGFHERRTWLGVEHVQFITNRLDQLDGVAGLLGDLRQAILGQVFQVGLDQAFAFPQSEETTV